jgi:16S rRNA (cytosine967-C5)-methyltransferase
LASEEGKGFALAKEKKIFASKSGFDGFYMALLERS